MDLEAFSILLGDTAHVRPKAFSKIRTQDPNAFGNFVTPIIESVRTPPAPITPYPTGRLFGVALSQALRARLRSVLSLRDAAGRLRNSI